jgi:hypothetical protein
MENQEEVKPVAKSKAQLQAEQLRITKLQIEQQRNYQAQMKQMKAETEDNITRINWFKARTELNELNKKYSDEKTAELSKIKWVIDELVQMFNLENKDAMYQHFNINIPVVEPIKTEENATED